MLTILSKWTVMTLKNAEVLSSERLMDKILLALEEGRPLSVVSAGATETFVMAQ